MAETKKFILVEFNEDTLVIGFDTTGSATVLGIMNFTERDSEDWQSHLIPPGDLEDEDDAPNITKLLGVLGWEYKPLPDWQHDLIVAATRCQMKHDDFTNKHRSLVDWFMTGAVYQADLLPPQLTEIPFSEPGCLFDGASGQAYNDMLACRLANCYGWLPEDGTLYHEFTEASASGYVEEALLYLNANCCARDVFLDWVEGDLMIVTKPEEELPFLMGHIRSRGISERMDVGLRAVDNDIRPLLIEEAKRVVARWKAVDGFIFAMGQAFFLSTKAMEWPWPKHVSLDDTTNNRGPIFGQIPKYAEDLLILAEEYGERFGYEAFRVNKDGEVIYDW